MFGFVLKFSYRLCFRLINLFRMLSRNVYYRVYYSTFHVRSQNLLFRLYIYIYFKKLEITRSNKLLAIYRLNSGRDNDLGQVKLETCYIHVLSRYLSCEFLTTQTCLLKYKLARTGNILKNWKRKYIYIFYHQFQIYLNQTFQFVIYIICNIRSNFNYFPQLHRAVSKKTDIYLFQLHEILFSSILNILLTSKLSYSLFYNQLRGNIRHDGVAFFFSVEKEAKRSLGSLLTPVTYVYYPSSLP